MTVARTDSIQICEGVIWESVSGARAQSCFAEESLEHLASLGLGTLMTDANPDALRNRVGERISTAGDVSTQVRVLKDDDTLVVKLSQGPFSYVASNVALETGFGQGSHFNTPHYLGALMLTDGRAITVMSRAEGKPLADVKTSFDEHDDYWYLSPLRQRVRQAGSAALQRVGMNPDIAIYWDLNVNNLFVPADIGRLDTVQDRPLTVMDQTSRVATTAHDWYEATRLTDQYGDRRDRLAEEASERAWSAYEPLTAA